MTRGAAVDKFSADPGEGAHIAVFYRGERGRDEVLGRYLAGAVERDESALCITDTPWATSDGRPGAPADSSGRVEVLPTEGSYLRDGRFASSAMTQWLAHLGQAAPKGSDARRIRIAGDLSWVDVLGEQGFDELIEYEASLNAVAAGCRHTLACFYDLGRLDAQQVIALLSTHPRAVIDGTLWDSPFYAESEPVDRSGAIVNTGRCMPPDAS